MKNSHVTPVKILKGVLVIALGVAVYFTERSLRNKDSGINEARRSADGTFSPDALAQFLAENPKKEKELSAPVRKKLRQKPTYIVQVKPKAYIKKQTSEEIAEFERQFQSNNFTKWQYPDFINVPQTSLGVIFYNGMRFFRQGTQNPPEFSKNSTGADTRANDLAECTRHHADNKNGNKNEDTGIIAPDLARSNTHPAQPPIGCCNGVPYNAQKRCCCRRASFDKDTKFCCAVDGCRDFRIMRKDEPGDYEACQKLSGMVVQEYGYHSQVENYPNFLSERDPPRRN